MTDDVLVDDAIDSAERAIGEGRPDDYRLSPTGHAEELQGAAPELARLLRRSALSTIASDFERVDAEAMEAQRAFKRTANRANRAVFATACLSAALLVAGTLANPLGDGTRQILVGTLAVAGVIAGGLAAMWVFQLKQGRLFERWMQARSRAEARRHQYFERATSEGDGGAPGSAQAMLLRLEYFRRYQLDVQVAYYRERGREHARAADRTLQLEALAVMLAGVAAGLAGGLAVATLQPEYTSVAALGVIASALAAYGATRETISGDRRNAERYSRTLESLVALRERLDEVRRAIARGDGETLSRFVEAVHEELSVEHRQWLASSERVHDGVARLEAALRSEPPRT